MGVTLNRQSHHYQDTTNNIIGAPLEHIVEAVYDRQINRSAVADRRLQRIKAELSFAHLPSQ